MMEISALLLRLDLLTIFNRADWRKVLEHIPHSLIDDDEFWGEGERDKDYLEEGYEFVVQIPGSREEIEAQEIWGAAMLYLRVDHSSDLHLPKEEMRHYSDWCSGIDAALTHIKTLSLPDPGKAEEILKDARKI